jgi:plastocyanin
LALGLNTINVAAPGNPWGDRTVKFQFGSADVKFSTLSLNGDAVYEGTTQTLTNTEGCDSLVTLDLTFVDNSTSSTEVVSACDSYTWSNGVTYTENSYVSATTIGAQTPGLFANGPNATWTNVYTACAIGDGNNGVQQSLTINVTALPAGGANYRVVKTVANGNFNNGNAQPLSVGNNTINVAAPGNPWGDRTVKFQFSSGGVEFDALSLNGNVDYSGVPSQILTSASGCDSTVTLDLSFTASSISTDVVEGCESYTWIDGNSYTESVSPVANTNHLIETVGMTFSPSSLNVFVGDTVTFVNTGGNHNVNGTTGTFSGNPESFGNAVGSGWTFTHIFGTAGTYDYQCDPHAPMMAGTVTVSEINNITHVIPNAAGCDSTITLSLTITNSSASVDIQTACGPFTWIDGVTYDEDNDEATFILQNAAGCDSTVTLDLEITEVDTDVEEVDENTLEAEEDEDATYQWLDCGDNYAPITGETNATFTTETSGEYAVEVSIDGCTDTSDCYTITSTVGINDLAAQYGIQLFPNPTTNKLTISLEGIDVVDMVLLDIQGKVLMQKTGLFNQDRINLSAYVAGTYFVRIITPEGSKEIRITKQ